jgi:hypothetical protein
MDSLIAELGFRWKADGRKVTSDDVTIQALISRLNDADTRVSLSSATKFWHGRRTLAASGVDLLDLASTILHGSGVELVDDFGDVVNFTKVHAIFCWNRSNDPEEIDPATDAILAIGGGDDGSGTNAFLGWFGGGDETEKLEAGARMMRYAGDTKWTVTAGTGDILRIENLDGVDDLEYEICVIGE